LWRAPIVKEFWYIDLYTFQWVRIVLITFSPNIQETSLAPLYFIDLFNILVRYFGIYSWSCFNDKRMLRLWILWILTKASLLESQQRRIVWRSRRQVRWLFLLRQLRLLMGCHARRQRGQWGCTPLDFHTWFRYSR